MSEQSTQSTRTEQVVRASETREERLVRVVRWLLAGKPWTAYIATPSHPAGTGWTVEDEAKDALNG